MREWPESLLRSLGSRRCWHIGSLGATSELGPSPLAFAGAVAVWFALGALLHAALAPLRSGGSPRVSRLPQPWRRKAAGSNATDGAVAADQDAGAGEFPAAVEDPAGIVVRTPAEEPVASLLAGPAAPVVLTHRPRYPTHRP